MNLGKIAQYSSNASVLKMISINTFFNVKRLVKNLPTHVFPSPVYPGLQVQRKLPMVFVHVPAGALAQLSMFALHSSISKNQAVTQVSNRLIFQSQPFVIYTTAKFDSSQITLFSNYKKTHIPLQLKPSPEKPTLQTHWKVPGKLVQVAKTLHGLASHSFISITHKVVVF